MTDKPTGQGLDLSKLLADLPKLISILHDPVLQKVLSNKPVTLQEILSLLPVLLQLLPGHAALPAPDKPIAEPEPVPAPVVEPPASSASTPGVGNPAVKASAIGLAISTVLQALGVVGMPFGVAPVEGTIATTTGTFATLVPILTGLVGYTGALGPVINVGLKLLSGLGTLAAGKKTT